MQQIIDKICNICGSEDYTDYLDFRDKHKKVVICSRCGTFRTSPYSDMDYTEQEFYCEHYLKNEKLYRGFTGDVVRILKRHKKNGRILDIGCSVGFLLDEAKKAGFHVEGLELNKKASDIANSRGFSVKCCELDEADYSEKSFDAVVLNHILEHIIEPNVFLNNIKRILRNDGIMVVAVPDHDSLVARICRRRWYGWGIPEHIWHFDKNTLAAILEKNSFNVKEMRQNSQYFAFSKSFRKNTIAILARIGRAVKAGDQIIAVAGVAL